MKGLPPAGAATDMIMQELAASGARRLDLGGRRILLVEDEALIAMMVGEALSDAGCDVVGPFSVLDEALEAAGAQPLDAALLDVNISGELVFAVADILASRHVPFLLVSGEGQAVLPAHGKHWPVCMKPFRMAEVLQRLGELMGPAPVAA